jgi:hypothetical protein
LGVKAKRYIELIPMKKTVKYLFLFSSLTGFLISSPIRNGVTDYFKVRPISEKALSILQENESVISKYAAKYDIPKEVLAASIGSEINRRIYINKATDFLQDIFFKFICSESLLNQSLNSEISSRYLNVAKQDIGLGNIRFETAWELFNKYPEEFLHIQSKKDMVDYLLSNRGNIHVASLVIKEAQLLFADYCTELDHLNKNAVLYSYYKEGKAYFNRYKEYSHLKRPPIPHIEGIEILEKINETLYLAN